MQKENTHLTERDPVVAIMGHIDHGKSTLLSYIRKSNKPLGEAGGITQHVSAYEVEHKTKEGKTHKITFIDTPGHEAFGGIRKRGAGVADIAILVVAGDDGVKPQTLDALKAIKASGTPYIVAINKIDKPDVNIEKTKQSLAENEIYIEGYGGDIPSVSVSAKTGEGVSELLDLISLAAELENLKGDKNKLAEGIVIESNRDTKKGISATCIIKDGSLKKGMFVTSGEASSPIRIMENYLGKPIDSASFSAPVKIIGWDSIPEVGAKFSAHNEREEARSAVEAEKSKPKNKKGEKLEEIAEGEVKGLVYLVIKADTSSSLEAIVGEIEKMPKDKVTVKIISSGVGTVSEGDIRLADGSLKSTVVGFQTKTDPLAKNLAERNSIEIQNFDVIYKLTDWLKEKVELNVPKVKTVETIGRAKVLKIFSKVKDRQIVGGRVEEGVIALGSMVKILRKDAEIVEGKIKELQQNKKNVSEVNVGSEFGTLIEAKIEIAPGDYIKSFTVVEK